MNTQTKHAYVDSAIVDLAQNVVQVSAAEGNMGCLPHLVQSCTP